MNSRQLGVIVATRATTQIHSTEHVPRALLFLLPASFATLVSLLHAPLKRPSVLAAAETVRLAIVAGADDLALGNPEQVGEGKELRGDRYHSRGRLFGTRRVDDCDAAVVSRECKRIARWREADAVHPACRAIQVLAADGVERQPFAPGGRLRTGISTFDERAENARVPIGAACCEKDGVRVPGDAGDGGAQGLLEVLGNPPVVFFLEVADGNDPRSGADSEFRLVRTPAHAGSGAVDAQQDERRLPFACGRGFPDVGVAILRAGDDAAAIGSDVDAGDQLVVAAELVLQAELGALLGVELDVVGAGDGEVGAVGGEAVVGDGRVEEVVHFGGGHGCCWVGYCYLVTVCFVVEMDIANDRRGDHSTVTAMCGGVEEKWNLSLMMDQGGMSL